MRLFELFDTRYSWASRVVADLPVPSVRATFQNRDGLEYHVSIKNVAMKSVSVGFYFENERGNPDFSIANTGDAFAVMSTVCAIVREYVDRYSPKMVGFRASFVDGTSRAKLYDRMIAKMAPTEYRLEVTTDTHGKQYIFTRTN